MDAKAFAVGPTKRTTRRQRTFGTRSSLLLVTLAVLALALWPAPASASGATIVTGAGAAVMTDPTTDKHYPLHFGLVGKVAADGSAKGHFTAVFHGAFANEYGADVIHLSGKVARGSVGADGTVVVEGTLHERDYKHGVGVIFESDEPFRIEAGGSRSSKDFSLTWCTLPVYAVHITNGGLRIHDRRATQPSAATKSVVSGRCR